LISILSNAPANGAWWLMPGSYWKGFREHLPNPAKPEWNWIMKIEDWRFLDDAFIEDMKEELLYAQHPIMEEDGRGLVLIENPPPDKLSQAFNVFGGKLLTRNLWTLEPWTLNG
jgi:hypothetical protein